MRFYLILLSISIGNGIFATDEKPAPVSVTAGEKQAPEINKKPKNKKRWSGQAGTSISLREKVRSNQQNGNTRKDEYETYRLHGHVEWKGERNTLRLESIYRYSSDENRIRDDFFNITYKHKYSFHNRDLFLLSKTLYQRDYNRRIENEYLQTAEFGMNWINEKSRIKLSTSTGISYHTYERLDSSRSTSQSFAKPKFIFDESFQWRLVETLTLKQKYTHLGNLKNYHFTFSFGVENKLVHNIFLRMEYRLDRDTEVLSEGYYDKSLITSLLYKF